MYYKTNIHSYTGLTAFSGTTRVRRYQKGKTNLDFTEARDSEWQWRQLCHMQVCTSLQTDKHASTPPLHHPPLRCPSCCLTNSVNALKAHTTAQNKHKKLKPGLVAFYNILETEPGNRAGLFSKKKICKPKG